MYNDNLAIKRAILTRNYLIKNGISESKIKYQSFRENNLVNNCEDDVKFEKSVHKLNRRIEFTIAF